MDDAEAASEKNLNCVGCGVKLYSLTLFNEEVYFVCHKSSQPCNVHNFIAA